MKERLSNLRKKCEKEEETLRLKTNQLKDFELCLSELQQRKQHALQELQRLAADTAQMEKEKRTLECVLINSRLEMDSISSQLQKLKNQRESFVLEVKEEELVPTPEQTLTDGSCMERKRIIMSVLEREEMERQLDSAKTELFAEQRRAREKLESMQEKLEETCEALQRATEAEISLRDKYVCLEEKQTQKKEQSEALEARVSELQAELGECKIRLTSLEKMLAQKELQLIDFQELHGSLQAERDGLKVELQHLKTKYYKMLKEAQEQAHRIMVDQQAEERNVSDLKEQTSSLIQRIESMQSSIQLKEEEAVQLRRSLEQERKQAKNREEQLHEALEKVHKGVDEERRKWEAEKMEAVQVHFRILEEQNRKSLENTRSEMQREKSKALALQHKVLELKTKVHELESEHSAQHREQESLLVVICKSLKEDHQAELQRLQKQMAQENQRTALHLEQAVQLAEKEADRLRVTLEERESSHKQITAELDQQLRTWAQELGAECQHLYLLVEQCGAKQNALHLPPSASVTEALTNLRTLREQLKHLISHLHQELNSQKQTSQQLRKDKERELSIQRQQLRLERDQALDFLKERLIQEHIEELSSLKWAHMGGEAADGGGVAESLYKQLKTKDLELRQVQRSMGQWKEKTAARLPCNFEEELTAELERKASDIQWQRKSEGMLSAKEDQNSFCSPFLHSVGSAASYSPSDVASLKLLCYLKSRVKQLRVENQAYTCSPTPPDKIPLDLSESHLTAITQGQDSAGI
ncbi:trichohyalin-like [Anabas testudineus]|uniref:trichohyalin-like n=1 Tax=Anabas testudineus TaxID=64144 RepID=UPI000E45D78D|nr:trichohyalin-like [Anabas testudineus]